MIIALTFLALLLSSVTESVHCGCSVLSPTSAGGSCGSQSPCCNRWSIADAMKILPTMSSCSANAGCGSCSVHPACLGPPPACKQQFRSMRLSRTPMITYDCLRSMQTDASNLAHFVQPIMNRCLRYPNAHAALEQLSNMANLYSMTIGQVANDLVHKSGCARPILRIHEAIVATISNLATSVEHVEYNIRMSGHNVDCSTVTNMLTNTARNYIGLLSAVMDKVKMYIHRRQPVLQQDAVLQAADNIAILAEQLAVATGMLLVTSAKCHTGNYISSLQELNEQMIAIERLAKELSNSQEQQLHPKLAVIAHDLYVLTYDVKLQASDQHTGHIKERTLQADYAHEMNKVLKSKNQHVNWIYQNFDSVTPAHASSEVPMSLLISLTELDTNLMAEAGKLMDRNTIAQKLALEFQISLEAAMAIVKAKMVAGCTSEEMQQALRMAISTEEYAKKALELIQDNFCEEIDTLTGLKYLKETITKLKEAADRDMAKIDDVSELATTLKYAVDIPVKCSKKLSSEQMALLRVMIRTAEKYHETVSSAVTASADRLVDKQLMSTLRSAIMQTWKMIFQNNCFACAGKASSVLQYARDMFAEFGVLFPKVLENQRVQTQTKLEKVKQLVAAESAMMMTHGDWMLSHVMQKQDMMHTLHEKFLMYLTHLTDFKQQAKDIINELTAAMRPVMNDKCQELHGLLQAMMDVIDVI